MSTAMNTTIPSYIDSSICLCGLLASKSSLPNNGELTELWRCIGDASASIQDGTNGKWWNTSLPSEELSGLNEPQNWAENPPDLSQAYVLVDTNGQSAYQKLGSGGSPSLVGADTKCNGKNDSSLSGMYYSKGKAALNLTSTSSSMTSTATSSGTSSTASSSTSTSGSMTSTTTPTSSTGSSTSATTTAASPKSAANHVTLRSAFLVGMVFAPLFALLM